MLAKIEYDQKQRNKGGMKAEDTMNTKEDDSENPKKKQRYFKYR